MEKRIGSVLILVKSRDYIGELNAILNKHAFIIIGRQGLQLQNRKINIISLIIEGTTDEIGSLTGQLGRLNGIQVKSVVLKYEKTEE